MSQHMEQGTQGQRYLAFSLGKEQYAIPLLQVKEVIGQTETTPMPYAPAHFKGIMNLRGQVISVIDLRLKFKMEAKESEGQTAIIILDLSPLSLGVVSTQLIACWHSGMKTLVKHQSSNHK